MNVLLRRRRRRRRPPPPAAARRSNEADALLDVLLHRRVGSAVHARSEGKRDDRWPFQLLHGLDRPVNAGDDVGGEDGASI